MHCLGGCLKALCWTVAIAVAACLGWPYVIFVLLLLLFTSK